MRTDTRLRRRQRSVPVVHVGALAALRECRHKSCRFSEVPNARSTREGECRLIGAALIMERPLKESES
jgi:hypothetical protein